jgi:hypothetical protein
MLLGPALYFSTQLESPSMGLIAEWRPSPKEFLEEIDFAIGLSFPVVHEFYNFVW